MEHAKDTKIVHMPLTFLKAGQTARVVKIDTTDELKLRKLAAFGVFPGTGVSLIQRYPAFVIQVGFTQVALDSDIASEIIVASEQ